MDSRHCKVKVIAEPMRMEARLDVSHNSVGLWTLCERIAASRGLPWATRDAQLTILPQLWNAIGGTVSKTEIIVEVTASYLVTSTVVSLASLEEIYLPLVVLLAAHWEVQHSEAEYGGRLLIGFTGAAASGARYCHTARADYHNIKLYS